MAGGAASKEVEASWSGIRGARPPVLVLAVCLVLAMEEEGRIDGDRP